MKKLSGMFSLTARDWIRSAILAAIVPPAQELGRQLLLGVTPHYDDIKRLGLIALGTFVSSLVMKLTTDNAKVAEKHCEQLNKNKDETKSD